MVTELLEGGSIDLYMMEIAKLPHLLCIGVVSEYVQAWPDQTQAKLCNFPYHDALLLN